MADLARKVEEKNIDVDELLNDIDKDAKGAQNVDTNEKKNEADDDDHKHEALASDSEGGVGDSDSDSDNGVTVNAEVIDLFDVFPKSDRKCFGYFTERGIQMWIAAYPKEYLKNKQFVHSMKHNADLSKPLYFWQLYSLLGYDKVQKLIQVFYKSIYEDKNAENQWFKTAFSQIGSVKHHIRTQTAFWLDAFGAGKKYHGGEFRLSYHHQYNASAVMTEKGAILWMQFMRDAIESKKVNLTKDPRVKPAIFVFLKVIMNKYGHDFKFKTDSITYE
eukprot:CAMPEP_0202692550 /NCGR_PEP_ID=MMETSP1385-20130828/6899_1 /ASSEMBLY_ACC=CAM_ASM_000861 /TAXON_ID=933848 /ORGANISM="Elphidium margaritaceum" /LENGTH=274 /DNA_ID=CAMNT_0049348095 /DNA_START=25 /DNA_END=849 /DNA_ORIENTATION=-